MDAQRVSTLNVERWTQGSAGRVHDVIARSVGLCVNKRNKSESTTATLGWSSAQTVYRAPLDIQVLGVAGKRSLKAPEAPRTLIRLHALKRQFRIGNVLREGQLEFLEAKIS